MNGIGKWILLVLAAGIPWLYGLSFPFLYDDVGMLAENTFLAHPENLGQVLTGRTLCDSDVLNGRRPAVLATYFADRALYGLRPAGWRVTQLGIHLGCAALLAGLVFRLTHRRFPAGAAGLLFALHPVVTEAVHAPGFRADPLCLLFMLAALHVLMGRRCSAWRLAAGLAAQALALLSKETALVFPAVLGAMILCFPGAFPEERRNCWRMLAGTALLSVGFFVLWAVTPGGMQAAGAGWNGESLRFPQGVWSFPALWTRTLRLALVPWPLNVTPAFEPVETWFSMRFFTGVFWLAVCGWGVFRIGRSAPAPVFGLVWMFLLFLPVSNLWPLYHPVADRYLYPVLPGFVVCVAWLIDRQSGRSRVAGLAALAVFYAVLLLWRVSQWSSAEKLWTTACFQNPRSATAATWLGLLRAEAGDLEEALVFHTAATEANPQAVSAWINRGSVEGQLGRLEESERSLRRALTLAPSSATAWQNLATCLTAQNRTEEAAEALRRAGGDAAKVAP